MGDFVDKNYWDGLPKIDELWAFDIDLRYWSMIRYNNVGKTPGPRTGHTMFAYQNALYLWGGTSQHGIIDSKLYRFQFDLGIDRNTNSTSSGSHSGTWEVVKTKGSLKPSPRTDHAGVLYKGRYYITGGECGENLAEFWCLD